MKQMLLVCLLALAPTLAAAQVSVHVYVPPVRVTVAPPPVRVEAPPPAPSPAYVWLGGHWAWRNNRNVWVPGQWAAPPIPGYTWVEPQWVPQGGQWVYYEGYWAAPVAAAPPVVYEPPTPPQPIVATIAPPASIVEVRPAAPFPNAIWIPGNWYWSGGRYSWVAGRWSAPHRGHAWVPGRWQRHGHEWRFAPGHWRRT